jgi:hypothetical protein
MERPRRKERFARLIQRRAALLGGPAVRAACGGISSLPRSPRRVVGLSTVPLLQHAFKFNPARSANFDPLDKPLLAQPEHEHAPRHGRCSVVVAGFWPTRGLDMANTDGADNLRTTYEQLCNSYRAIDDFRSKLLGFLPLITGGGLILLMGRRNT